MDSVPLVVNEIAYVSRSCIYEHQEGVKKQLASPVTATVFTVLGLIVKN